MKKVIPSIIALTICLSFSSCNNPNENNDNQHLESKLSKLEEENSQLKNENSQLEEENLNFEAEELQEELAVIVQNFDFNNPHISITDILETGMSHLCEDRLLVSYNEETNTYTVFTYKEGLANYVENEEENASKLLNGYTESYNNWLIYLTELIHKLDANANINMKIVSDVDPKITLVETQNGEIVYNILD